MATETTNYHFIKPGDTDPVDNTPLNQNFDSIDAAIADHVADTNNPHQVTKEQVGLGNVDNVATKDAIAELIDNGAKNLIQNVATSRTENGVTFTVNSDGSVSLSGTATGTIWFQIMSNLSINAGTYTISNGLADDTARVIVSPTNSISQRIFDSNESRYITRTVDAISGVNAYLRIAEGKVTDGAVVKPMLCAKAAWDISHEFVPYAKSNYELTVTEDEDRASLVELVDGGAKNILDFANLSRAGGTAIVVKTDDEITASSTTGFWISAAFTLPILPSGTYTFSAFISDYSISGGAARIIITKTIGGQQVVGGRTLTADGKMEFKFVSSGEQLYLLYYPNYSSSSNTNSFTASQNMICTEATWGISQTYQPYRPSYDELVARIEALEQAAGINSVRSMANLTTETVADTTETEGGAEMR